MYYATKRNNTQTRIIGIAGVAIALTGTGYMIANGLGLIENKAPVESEVVIIEEVEDVKDEPPPPPPVDVDLPPPPPQVILPDFVFNDPPPENVFKDLAVVKEPVKQVPPPVKSTPPPPPAVSMAQQPKPGRRFEKPDYPPSAKRAGEAGEVTVTACVDKDGRMTDVKLVKSSGFPRLDEATIKGLPKTRLDPAVGTDGKPMAMCNPPYRMTLVWELK